MAKKKDKIDEAISEFKEEANVGKQARAPPQGWVLGREG